MIIALRLTNFAAVPAGEANESLRQLLVLYKSTMISDGSDFHYCLFLLTGILVNQKDCVFMSDL
jgi:hypothetical protein